MTNMTNMTSTTTTKTLGFNTKSSVITDYSVRLVGNYGELLSLGFSDENWARAGNILQGLSKTLSLKHYSMLGNLMAETYVNPNQEEIMAVVGRIQSDLKTGRSA